MTRPFTKAQIARAVAGAREAGLAVKAVSIAPDGTIVIHHDDIPVAPEAAPADTASEWNDRIGE